MQYAKKMALVDPRLVESLLPRVDQSSSTPRSRVLSSLDSDMKDILERSDLSEREKVASYNQLLSRYNTIEAARAAQPVRVSVVNSGETPAVPVAPAAAAPSASEAIEREIVASMPKTLKEKTRLLIEKMKADPLSRWNDRGEFVYDGKAIAGSNMVDLVNDLMRTRSKTTAPVGWREFGLHMKDMNIPMEFVGNPRYRSYVKQRRKRLLEERMSRPSTSSSSAAPTERRRQMRGEPKRRSVSMDVTAWDTLS